jgi:hypothetical protein
MLYFDENEQYRGELPKDCNIATVLAKVFEKSKTINKIPEIPYCKIKERILENFIEVKINNK